MTFVSFVHWLILGTGALWGLYLAVSAFLDVKRQRRRAWWRESPQGDFMDLRRKM